MLLLCGHLTLCDISNTSLVFRLLVGKNIARERLFTSPCGCFLFPPPGVVVGFRLLTHLRPVLVGSTFHD